MRHRERFEALITRVLGPAQADLEIRMAALSGRPLPGLLAPWAEEVRNRADSISDEEVSSLRSAGLSDDVIFEITVCLAVGEGERRRAAWRRVRGAACD
jgi:hypothetical protein